MRVSQSCYDANCPTWQNIGTCKLAKLEKGQNSHFPPHFPLTPKCVLPIIQDLRLGLCDFLQDWTKPLKQSEPVIHPPFFFFNKSPYEVFLTSFGTLSALGVCKLVVCNENI